MSAGAGAEFTEQEAALIAKSTFNNDKALTYDEVVAFDSVVISPANLLYKIEVLSKKSNEFIREVTIVNNIVKTEPDKINFEIVSGTVEMFNKEKEDKKDDKDNWVNVRHTPFPDSRVTYTFKGKHLVDSDPEDPGTDPLDGDGYPVIYVRRIFAVSAAGGKRKNKSRRRYRKGKKSQSRRRR